MNLKFIQRIGIFGFLIQIGLALYFYLERSIMIDMSFQIFSLLKTNSFIHFERFPAVLTKILPYIGSQLNVNLKAICILYSISFPFIHCLFFIIISFYFKNIKISILFFIFHFFIINHSFFWAQCTLIQGFSWLCLLFAFIESFNNFKKKNLNLYIISLVLILFIVFIHPLAFLLFFYLHLFILIESRTLNKIILFNVLTFLVIYVLKICLFSNGYESSFSEKIVYFLQHLSEERKILKIQYIYENFIFNYPFLVLALFLVSAYLIYIKKILQLLLLLGFSVSLIILIFISYRFKNELSLFYIEGQYNLITFFIALPFVYFILPQCSTFFLKFFLSFLLIFFCLRILNTSSEYTNRVNYIRSLIKENLNHKTIKLSKAEDWRNLKLIWGSSYESWIISTLELGHSSSIIIHDNPRKYQEYMQNTKIWITEWESIPYEELNPRYFKFKDTCAYVYK